MLLHVQVQSMRKTVLARDQWLQEKQFANSKETDVSKKERFWGICKYPNIATVEEQFRILNDTENYVDFTETLA